MPPVREIKEPPAFMAERVFPKDDIRIEANGCLDELNAVIGITFHTSCRRQLAGTGRIPFKEN